MGNCNVSIHQTHTSSWNHCSKNSGHHCMGNCNVSIHQVQITAQKTVDIIVWVIVMLAFIRLRHTHQAGITAQKTVDIIVWVVVMLAFIRHTHQVGITFRTVYQTTVCTFNATSFFCPSEKLGTHSTI